MQTADFFFRVRKQLRLHITAETFQTDSGKDAFRRTAGAEDHMNTAALNAAVDGRYDIPIGDETDACTGFSGFADDAFMSFTIKDNNGEIRDLTIHRFRHAGQVFSDRCIDIDASLRSRADADLLHIHIRCVEQATLRCNSKDRDRAIFALRYQVRPFDRIDSDVDLFSALTDFFADIQHRCFIDLAFADDDSAGDWRLGKLLVHTVYRSLIRAFLIACPHQTTSQKCSLFCDSYKFH